MEEFKNILVIAAAMLMAAKIIGTILIVLIDSVKLKKKSKKTALMQQNKTPQYTHIIWVKTADLQNEQLRKLCSNKIVVGRLGQLDISIYVHESGEILSATSCETILRGLFVDMSRLDVGENINVWSNGCKSWVEMGTMQIKFNIKKLEQQCTKK